jgi:hypothetical protein
MSTKVVAYMGGAAAVLTRARADFAKGEYRWVAQYDVLTDDTELSGVHGGQDSAPEYRDLLRAFSAAAD